MCDMSCPEVVYQAYYPYLYQRASTSAGAVPPRTSSFPPYYDRLNVQQPYGAMVAGSSGGGSVSSGGGAPSPASPPASRHKDDDHRDSDGRCDDDVDDDDEGGSRAQYMSANCVVFTNYEGDVAAVVDQHFNRALYSGSQDKGSPQNKECSPMSSRNFPASFWNQSSVSTLTSPHSHGDLYGESVYHHGHAASATAADPWHAHYQQYTAAAHHHRAVHDYHHHHQHMGYGGLLLPPSSRLAPHAQYSKAAVDSWNHRLHHEQGAHHLDPASSYASYSSMTGLDGSQEPTKDLYWF